MNATGLFIRRPVMTALLMAAITLHVVLAAPKRAVALAVAGTLMLYLQGLFLLLLAAEGVLALRRRQLRLVGAVVERLNQVTARPEDTSGGGAAPGQGKEAET